MKTQQELLEIVREELSRQSFNSDPENLFQPISYTLSQGGKRLRPVLTLMTCEMLGGAIEEALYPALGLEIFHNFTLIHDDILDNAPLRRGKETVFKKWNANIAILSGDTMFAIAYTYFFKTKEKHIIPILNVFNDAVVDVCKGQQYDMDYETSYDVSISDYIEMIRLKTAVLLGTCAKVGAVIAGAQEENLSNVYNFAEKLGLAFQLKDDLLDLYGNETLFGKTTGGDIESNKKTFLFLKALEVADPHTRKELQELYAIRNTDPKQKIEKVKAIYEKLRIKELTEEAINTYYKEAVDRIDALSVQTENKEHMYHFARKLMARQY